MLHLIKFAFDTCCIWYFLNLIHVAFDIICIPLKLYFLLISLYLETQITLLPPLSYYYSNLFLCNEPFIPEQGVLVEYATYIYNGSFHSSQHYRGILEC